ncbi:ChrR family anti-sigma-E factor [Endozoicomonas sp.]|nr:ChrR family anti-sigma-E factor [Endozoicomonas sp.]
MTLIPSHHPDKSTLISYAAGSLPEHQAIAISCHLHTCDICRDTVSKAEQLGSLLLEEIKPTAVSSTVRHHLIRQLDTTLTDSSAKDNPPMTGDIPPPLSRLVGYQLDTLNWKRLVPGIKQLLIRKSPQQGQLRLLKIAPGTCMPAHSHSGSELTLVLKGSYTDETGRYRAGDIADMDSDIHHQPVADTHEACICLIASDGPLKFNSWVPRLLQPFFGI